MTETIASPDETAQKRKHSEQRQRTEVVALRLLPAERDLLEQAADALDVSLSELIRSTALAALGNTETATTSTGGQFMHIAFMGHVELTGYVTEITIGGEPGYHIDLPDKLWGGNPLAWEEYSAKVLFGRRPMTEESVRLAWESERRRVEERRRQAAEWEQRQQRALTADADHDPDEDLDDDDDDLDDDDYR